MRRISITFALAISAATATAGEEIPFPVRKSTTASRDGASYIVEGHQHLGKGVSITCKQGIRIVGRGDDPTLVVSGALFIKGQPKQNVFIENVRIELAPQFQEVRMDWVQMTQGEIVAPTERAVSGKLTIENTTVRAPTRLAFRKGEIRLLRSEFRDEVVIEGVASEGKTASTAKVQIIGCSKSMVGEDIRPGFWRGLRVKKMPSVLVRANCLADGRYEFEDCAKLMFDGNAVLARETVFRQTKPGGFRHTRVTKCDFHEGDVRFLSPKAKKRAKVIMDKCWFRNLKEPRDILQNVIRIGSNEEQDGVTIVFRKINARPLGIGGTPMR